MSLLIPSTGKPRVILGLMTFGPDASAGARITSLDEYNKCLDYFQSQGYNEIDTARVYIGGKQEAFTKEARWQERGLTLATKVYPHEPGTHRPEKLRESLETSLRELGTNVSVSMVQSVGPRSWNRTKYLSCSGFEEHQSDRCSIFVPYSDILEKMC